MMCVTWNLALIHLYTVLVSMLGEEAQVEARFGLFGDSANLDAR